jgi:haloacetate dehalogenase
MAKDIVRVMDHLGHIRFRVLGHDRGARVGYRLALDHPGRVERLAVLDIIPTLMMWEAIQAGRITTADHWISLARPAPLPEQEIGKDSWAWQQAKLAGWSGDKTLKRFDPRAIQHYRTFFLDPSRIAATCADYRAGATTDRAADAADRAGGRTIDCPVLAIWGASGIPASGVDPLEAWRPFAPEVTGVAVDSGHFIPEENPDAARAALEPFL